MPRTGQPEGWNERFKSNEGGPTLPPGADFYVTPGHGYLRVDTRLHPLTKVTSYDYQDGPHHVLLEEDCSAPAWLDEYNRQQQDREPDPATQDDDILSGLAQSLANKTGKVISIEPAGIRAEPKPRHAGQVIPSDGILDGGEPYT